MKIESYGYKFLITAMGGAATKGTTFLITNYDEAFQRFCDILESGRPVGVLLYKHGEMIGSASMTAEEYADLGSEECWKYAMKYCEMFNDTK